MHRSGHDVELLRLTPAQPPPRAGLLVQGQEAIHIAQVRQCHLAEGRGRRPCWGAGTRWDHGSAGGLRRPRRRRARDGRGSRYERFWGGLRGHGHREGLRGGRCGATGHLLTDALHFRQHHRANQKRGIEPLAEEPCGGSGVVVLCDRLVVRRSYAGRWEGFLFMSLTRRSPSRSTSGGFWVLFLLLEGLKERNHGVNTTISIFRGYGQYLRCHG